MIPPGAEIRSPRMTCPRAPLFLPRFPPPPPPSSFVAGHSGIYPRAPCESERGAKILLDWNPYTACTKDQLASIDRPSLFICKRINKRSGETVYGARSDDKIGSCKSAGYLTGRRTILEYLPSSLRHPTLPAPCRQVTRSPARVLQPSSRRSFLCTGSSLLLHARRTIFLFVLFSLSKGRPVRSQRAPTPSCPKITKLGHG